MARACGWSRVQVPAEADTKTSADVGNLMTMPVSAGLSKDSGSIHLINTIQTQEQHNKTLQTTYTLELDLGPFPPDVTCSFPPK